MLKISIPTPCYEDWNKMPPDETGRHCSSCAKSVVDFTAMTDDEVQNFFLNKKEEHTCGRFKRSQLKQAVIELPENIFSSPMPLWKKFLAACLIVFSTTLFSCETKLQGDMMVEPLKTDTIIHDEGKGYVGGFMLVYDSIPVTDKPVTTEDTVTTITLDCFNTGIILIPPDPTAGVQPIDTISAPVIIPAKTKNPPKADSTDCNTIKNYY